LGSGLNPRKERKRGGLGGGASTLKGRAVGDPQKGGRNKSRY